MMGAERARDQVRMLGLQAVRHLDPFDHRADPLRAAARYIADRLD
jgi:farnesyl diphosphate synthase